MKSKQPPYNENAEKAVVGAAMLSNDEIENIRGIITPHHFYNENLKLIYSIILELYSSDRPADPLTVAEELEKKNMLDKVGGMDYVGSLTGYLPTLANAGEYAKIVYEKAILRNLIKIANNIAEKSYSAEIDAAEILEEAEKKILEVAKEKQNIDYVSIKEILKENIKRIHAACDKSGQVSGISTGFKDLDNMLSGLQKSDLFIMAGRPAMGKTTFALNIAKNVAMKDNNTVIIFSLEMADVQLGEKLISMQADVDTEKMKKGEVSDSDWIAIGESLNAYSEANIFIDHSSGISVNEIRNKCRRLASKQGSLELIVIDHLQLMETGKQEENRNQEISKITRSLKGLAKEMNCTVIALCQLSRQPGTRKGNRPILSDLRDSGSIEQDADIVTLLYRDDYYDPDTEKKGVTEVIIAKHRNGPVGTVELAWIPRVSKFGNLARL